MTLRTREGGWADHIAVGVLLVVAIGVAAAALGRRQHRASNPIVVHRATVNRAVAHDVSPALASVMARHYGQPGIPVGYGHDASPGLSPPNVDDDTPGIVAVPSRGPGVVRAGARIEQRTPGSRAALPVLASFDGLGAGFTGPQGTRRFVNPSDNTLAVGPDHIVQIVNGGMAVFTKRGTRYDTTGRVLYGPVRSNAIFDGFGGPCETRSSGDAVVRYDQLANRWLYVLPVFQRGTVPPFELSRVSHPGQAGQPGEAGPRDLIDTPVQPSPPPPGQRGAPGPGSRGRGPAPPGAPSPPQNPYSMCYAVSVGPDPLGPYYRYEFLRPLFPDYPRPAIWPDGYYVPSSTSDNFIQKHACVVDRNSMLQGLPATEQCIV
ncbi:MAG: hypothetical protein ACRELE_08020, partial [Gemmatimonadales bacterium]